MRIPLLKESGRGSAILIAVILIIGVALAAWKVAGARAAADHRCSVATITKAGLALLARMDPEIAAELRRRTHTLTRPQLQQLAQLTEALVD